MTFWRPYTKPVTIEQAYYNVRSSISDLEELLEAFDGDLDDARRKRSDKAVTVIKVGAKILKKAFGLRKHDLEKAA